MADETPKTAAQLKAEAIKEWHECVTPEQKRDCVAKYPVLKEIYSQAKNF